MLRHQHKIERNVARLLEIIEYMARMTRLSNIDTAGEWVTICDVFKDVEQKTRPLRAIDIDYTDTDYKTKMSAEQLFELLFLLLDNAMTFSAPDARISLTCRYNTANLLISIRDEGIGIASEDIDKILLPFYKVDNARTQIESTGAGLGLTIANMIVKTFDGSLTVLSELNVGTTVIVQLPIAEETHPEQENYHSSL